jgi:starch-binding outer membrane protein, SusD/RagB family
MKDKIKYIPLVLLFAGLFSCELFEPIDENLLTPEYVESDPESAEGLLIHAYTGLISHTNFTATATDDAVHNNLNDAYRRMATGQLSAEFNPAQRWDKYTEIFYINKFINVLESDKVRWNQNDTVNLLFKERLLGEALAMRGLYHFYILQAHAGLSSSGQLLGIPYYEEFMGIDDDFDIPRLSFEATVQKISADLNQAIGLLPLDYSDQQADVLPRYEGYEFGLYKIVNGAQYKLRISGRITRAIKARVELFAASPAFLNGGGYYEKAAETAAGLIALNHGLSGISSSNIEFYTSDAKLKGAEFLWRSSLEGSGSSWLEEQNYPPSVNGSGDINPTHNLVSAFPMANGYPATVANGYDPQNPFENRDPRLSAYIVFNGSSLYDGASVNTGVGGGINRLDSIPEESTRTGYYLKKLLRTDVRINNDGSIVGAKHINIYFRYTELYLILAEAANELGGPDYSVSGFTARDIIAAIRERAGITQPDGYLASVSSKEDMRALIQNERRLELCFEGHRFWDIRRWGLPLNESVSGYFFNGSEYVEVPEVESRDYPSYARYLPIPNSEITKFSALEQNQGW